MRILVGKPKRKRLLGRKRRRWMDIINIVLGEIGWGGMNYIDLLQDRDRRRSFMKTEMNPLVPWNVGKLLSDCTTGGFSKRCQLHEVT
jgi:hypothetical protein